MFVNYAHRGASAYAPDSTIASFDLGIAMKADGIETDIQKTADGRLVLFHNYNLDGRSSGTGKLADYTLDELKKMDFGSWKDEKYKGERIVTMEEFAQRYFGLDLTFALEMKSPDCEKDLLEIIRRYGVMDKVYVTSFFYQYLARMRALSDEIRLSWLVGSIEPETYKMLQMIRGTQICPRATTVTEEEVKRAKQDGFEVRLWGVTDTDVMRRVCRWDIDGMTVNFPDELYKEMHG